MHIYINWEQETQKSKSNILIPNPSNNHPYWDKNVIRLIDSVSDATKSVVLWDVDIFNIRIQRIDESFWVIDWFKKIFEVYIADEDSRRDDPSIWNRDEIVINALKEYHLWETQYSDIIDHYWIYRSLERINKLRWEVLDILLWKLIVWDNDIPWKVELHRYCLEQKEKAA